jgi:predicted DNA-binding transcriptional regulator AlpA
LARSFSFAHVAEHFAGDTSKGNFMRILRYADLTRKGVCGSWTSLHRLRQDDQTFPQPVAIGGGIGWYEDEIDAWLKARPRIVKRNQTSTVVANKAAQRAAAA